MVEGGEGKGEVPWNDGQGDSRSNGGERPGGGTICRCIGAPSAAIWARRQTIRPPAV